MLLSPFMHDLYVALLTRLEIIPCLIMLISIHFEWFKLMFQYLISVETDEILF